MRKYFFVILFCLSLVGLGGAVRSQEETVSLTLQVPAQFFMNICPDKPFQGVKVYWKGVEDQRTVKMLGVVSKKEGKDPVQVVSEPPLQSIFQNYLTSLLEGCGMQLVQRPEDAPYQLQAVIQEFHAEEEKSLVTGKGQAKSRLEFTGGSAERKITANVGYGVDFKQIRKSGVERLQKVLNELLQETLRQVPASAQLRTMK